MYIPNILHTATEPGTEVMLCRFLEQQIIFSGTAQIFLVSQGISQRLTRARREDIPVLRYSRRPEDRAINITGAINFYCPFSRLVPGKNTHYKSICFISFKPHDSTAREIR